MKTLQLAAHIVSLIDIAVEVVGIGRAAAAAVELRETFPAQLAGTYGTINQ